MDQYVILVIEKLSAMDELSSCKENLCTLKSELWVVTDIKIENCL